MKGALTQKADLAPFTWFRVGGPADILFQPADEEDLAAFLEAVPADVPVMVIGVASNMLIRSGGIEGVVIRLGRGFTKIEIEGTNVRAGAGALDMSVAKTAQKAGLAGLEFLRGIPGALAAVCE